MPMECVGLDVKIAMFKKFYVAAAFLFCTSCDSTGEPTLPATLADAERPETFAPVRISGLCRQLSPERAIEYNKVSKPVGTIGRWTITGMNGGPFCTEPYLDQDIECEMGVGDVVVLTRGEDLIALQNTYDGPTSIRISPHSLTCSPFVVE